MTFLGAGLWLLLVTIVIWLTVRETAPKMRNGQIHIINDLRTAFSNRMLRAVLLITVFVQASLTVLQPVLSLQVAKLGRSSSAPILAGLIYSLAGFATVIAAPLWAKRARRTGFRPVLLTGLLGATIFNAPMAFVRNLYVFGALRFATGLATAGASLSENALTAKAVDAEFRGRAFGILASARQMGQMIGPLAGGITGSSMGLEATFIFTTGMLLATLAAAARYLPRERVAGAQQ
jgi:MFS family permease